MASAFNLFVSVLFGLFWLGCIVGFVSWIVVGSARPVWRSFLQRHAMFLDIVRPFLQMARWVYHDIVRLIKARRER